MQIKIKKEALDKTAIAVRQKMTTRRVYREGGAYRRKAGRRGDEGEGKGGEKNFELY